MVLIKRLLLPFVIGGLLAVRFFAVRDSDTGLWASILGPAIQEADMSTADLMYVLDAGQITVTSTVGLADVDTIMLGFAYDTDGVAIDFPAMIPSDVSITIDDGDFVVYHPGPVVAGEEMVVLPFVLQNAASVDPVVLVEAAAVIGGEEVGLSVYGENLLGG